MIARAAAAVTGLVAIAAACGRSAPVRPATRDVAAARLVPDPASPADVVVARVNSRPVYGSCVAAQATRARTDARGALEQCIELEVLAQAAEARGLATDPGVVDATRTALVNRMVELGFEATHRTPADLTRELDTVLARDPRGNGDVITVPELRASAYARVNLAATDSPARVEQARVLATAVYDALAAERGLLAYDLEAALHRLADGKGFELGAAPVPLHSRAYFDEAYGARLFEGTGEVGRVNPPVRTSLGWDVVLLLDVRPSHPLTRAERITELFPEVRRSAFKLWVDGLARSLGVKITLDPQAADRLLQPEGT